jgi:methionine-rich copper-binding protein CopC
MRRAAVRLAAVMLAVAASVLGRASLAHAFLDHALPAVGSTVHEPPHSVRLWFTERLEPTFSRVRVVDTSGKQVNAGDSHVDQEDPTLLTVAVPALPPGSYRVVWRVVSADTHVTEGDFTFDIAP